MNKKKYQLKWIPLTISSVLFFGCLLPSLIRHGGDHLGKNLQHVNHNGNLFSLPGITVLFGVVFGIFAIILSYFISVVLRKNLIRKIKQTFFQDKIVYMYHPMIMVSSLAQFAIGGGFFGGYIVPFFLFSEITHIDMVTRHNVVFYIIYGIIGFLICTLWETYTVFLTNKRIIGVSCGGSFIIRKTVLSFDDIKSINKTFGGWEIISKDGTMLPLKCHPKAKKFYNKLKELMNKEKINEQC